MVMDDGGRVLFGLCLFYHRGVVSWGGVVSKRRVAAFSSNAGAALTLRVWTTVRPYHYLVPSAPVVGECSGQSVPDKKEERLAKMVPRA